MNSNAEVSSLLDESDGSMRGNKFRGVDVGNYCL